MAKFMIKTIVSWCFLLTSFAFSEYTPPKATVVPLSPKGIKISIPDETGITLVAFHVKFNEDFNGLEAGTIARDIVRTRNGRWTYEDHTTKLHAGDVIYYWIHVIYEGLGYNLVDQQYEVRDFINTGDENQDCSLTETKIIDLATGERKNVCAGQILLHEQFDDLNRTIWTMEEKFTGYPDYAFVIYRNDERNVKCANGNLEIKPSLVTSEKDENFIRHGNLTLERCTGEQETVDCQRKSIGAYILPPVFSGLVNTKNSFAFLYGKIEIRAKLPRGDWVYPILSLERFDKFSALKTSNHPQLRIASSSGNSILFGPNDKDYSGHILRGGPSEINLGTTTLTSLPKKHSNTLWSDDYHVYELEWSRDEIITRVDGLKYGTTKMRTAFDKPFYLTLGVAVGGHIEFPDSVTSDGYAKPWRNVGSKAVFDFFNATHLWSCTWNDDSTSLKIDYVKVWAL